MATGEAWPTVTPRTRRTAGTSAPATTSWPSGATRFVTWPSGSRWAASTNGPTPTSRSLIDDRQGLVVGFWRQIAGATRADGSHYEVAGIGGSWFKYGGKMQWAWQRDWFDFGNAGATFMEMIRDGTLSEGMTARMHRALTPDLPGHYELGQAPAPLWPPGL